jgi:hypothetical protein
LIQLAVGLALLLGLAGTVRLSRNASRATSILVVGFVAAAAVVLAWSILSGQFMAPSGMEADGAETCGFARVC